MLFVLPADLIGAVVAQQEDTLVAGHLLVHSLEISGKTTATTTTAAIATTARERRACAEMMGFWKGSLRAYGES